MYYFGDYTAREGWAHSTTNKIITNIKKHPETKSTPQWKYKLKEIARIGGLIRRNLNPEAISSITFVPAPPSKPPSDPDYDDRMLQLGRAVGDDSDVRPSTKPVGTHIILLDDVLVTGATFRSCSQILLSQFPDATVSGLFVARRTLQKDDLGEWL